jgi:hypothetical protein
MEMDLIVDKEQLKGCRGGLNISIPGFKGNPDDKFSTPVYIEYYEGKLLVHIWRGEPDPLTIEIPPEDKK